MVLSGHWGFYGGIMSDDLYDVPFYPSHPQDGVKRKSVSNSPEFKSMRAEIGTAKSSKSGTTI